MRLFYILILLISYQFTTAQPTLPKNVSDSLWNLWKDKSQADSIRLGALHRYTWDGYLFSQPDSAFYYSQLEYNFAKRKGFKKGMSVALLKTGISFSVQGKYDKALESHFNGLKIAEDIDNKKMMSYHLSNIGVNYEEQGVFDKAIAYHLKGLKIDEGHGDKLEVGRSLGNIGIVYMEQEMYPKAIHYFNRSLKIFKEIDDSTGIATVLNNLGIVYKEQKNYPKAIECQKKALKIQEKINDERGMTSSLNNLGVAYQMIGQFDKAIKLHEASLQITKKIKDKRGQAISLNNLGEAYKEKKNYTKTIEYSSRALKIAKERNILVEVKNSSFALFESYKKLNRFAEALQMHELFIQTRDSIKSEENQRAVIQQEYKYKYEKQAALDSLNYTKEQKLAQAEAAKKNAEIKVKRNQQYALLGGLLITLLFTGFLYNRFKVTRKQKSIIEKQKNEVSIQKSKAEKQRDFAKNEHKRAEQQKQLIEEKNAEILKSIDTAKRLRASILPPVKLVKQNFDTSFVIYKSKKIINNNFYWMEAKEKVILFAVATYAGHSASSTMISVSYVSLLNKAVNELNETDPATILNTAFDLMKSTYSASIKEIRNNMNITLCVLNENTETLMWAGAKNSLWVIRDKQDTLEEIELATEKKNYKEYFISQTVNINGGDSIYMFSNGQINNLSDEKTKKSKISELKNTLFTIRHKSMTEQKKELNKTFENWQEESKQMDDICMIGVKLPKKENNPFTRREKEVLQLIEQGLPSKIIADKLSISKLTVDTHRKKILKKAGTNSVTELLRVCKEKKWL